jgi:ribosomal protein L20A (L18A)
VFDGYKLEGTKIEQSYSDLASQQHKQSRQDIEIG